MSSAYRDYPVWVHSLCFSTDVLLTDYINYVDKFTDVDDYFTGNFCFFRFTVDVCNTPYRSVRPWKGLLRAFLHRQMS